MTNTILKALSRYLIVFFFSPPISGYFEVHKTMQTTSLVYYFLLASLCIDFSQNEMSAHLRRQRRRIRNRGLRTNSSAGHRSPRQQRIRPPDPVAAVPSIPLINIDDGVMGVFESFIGLGGQESSYNILPGKTTQSGTILLLISNETNL